MEAHPVASASSYRPIVTLLIFTGVSEVKDCIWLVGIPMAPCDTYHMYSLDWLQTSSVMGIVELNRNAVIRCDQYFQFQ